MGCQSLGMSRRILGQDNGMGIDILRAILAGNSNFLIAFLGAGGFFGILNVQLVNRVVRGLIDNGLMDNRVTAILADYIVPSS